MWIPPQYCSWIPKSQWFTMSQFVPEVNSQLMGKSEYSTVLQQSVQSVQEPTQSVDGRQPAKRFALQTDHPSSVPGFLTYLLKLCSTSLIASKLEQYGPHVPEHASPFCFYLVLRLRCICPKYIEYWHVSSCKYWFLREFRWYIIRSNLTTADI